MKAHVEKGSEICWWVYFVLPDPGALVKVSGIMNSTKHQDYPANNTIAFVLCFVFVYVLCLYLLFFIISIIQPRILSVHTLVFPSNVSGFLKDLSPSTSASALFSHFRNSGIV